MKAFIIFRDRVTYAKMCYAALRAAGLDVYVVDHDTTWPAALLWLRGLETPVMYRGENAYPWQLWQWGPFRDLMGADSEPYVVTDPDVVPSQPCPADWLAELSGALTRHRCVKAGLGLRLDRLPPGPLRDFERQFWADEVEPGVFAANVDTTLALYRPFGQYPLFALGPSLRLGWPYVADHLGWDEKLTPELRHYHARADPGHGVARIVKD